MTHASPLLAFLILTMPAAGESLQDLRKKITDQVGLAPSRELAMHAQFVAEAHARAGNWDFAPCGLTAEERARRSLYRYLRAAQGIRGDVDEWLSGSGDEKALLESVATQKKNQPLGNPYTDCGVGLAKAADGSLGFAVVIGGTGAKDVPPDVLEKERQDLIRATNPGALTSPEAERAAFLETVNAARAKVGYREKNEKAKGHPRSPLAPLALSLELSAAAQHLAQMLVWLQGTQLEKDIDDSHMGFPFVGHWDLGDRVGRVRPGNQGSAEAVGGAMRESKTPVVDAVEGWMKSETHFRPFLDLQNSDDHGFDPAKAERFPDAGYGHAVNDKGEVVAVAVFAIPGAGAPAIDVAAGSPGGGFDGDAPDPVAPPGDGGGIDGDAPDPAAPAGDGGGIDGDAPDPAAKAKAKPAAPAGDGGGIDGDAPDPAAPKPELANGKPVRGRFVLIELPRVGTLTLPEVEVYAGGKNVAPEGEASQSSTDYDGEAARANDGNTDGIYFNNTSSHTSEDEDSPWWQVDLKTDRDIEAIVVWNRTDEGGKYQDRLAGFTVAILDEGADRVWEKKDNAAPAPSVRIPVGGAAGGGGGGGGGAPAPAKNQAGQAPKAPLDPGIEGFMKVHNEARAAVGVPPLKWSPQLASYAKEWADTLAAEGGKKIRHRQPNKFGENLAWGTSMEGSRAAMLWLGEKKAYNGETMDGRNFNTVGHYTQMVWRESTEVGFAIVRIGDTSVIVANYSPAGNMRGKKPY